eukprot:scpid86078/ scgid26993/ Calcium-dependent protein kinase 4
MPPFNGGSDQEIMKKVRIGKFSFSDACWSNVSDKCKDIITQMLTYDPEKRSSAEVILQHCWITELSGTEVDSGIAQGALSNLKTFRADQKLKQATFAFIASQLLSKSEKEHLSKIFKAVDKNGDGKLSKEEIYEGYEEYFGKHLDKEDIDKMFDSVDTDKSGFIDYSEFVVASMNEKTLLSNEKLQAAFKMFDKDGSGTITGSEIKEVLNFGGNMSEEATNLILKQVDANGDGEISYEEFVLMMRKLSI